MKYNFDFSDQFCAALQAAFHMKLNSDAGEINNTLTNRIAYVTMTLINERKEVMQKFNRATAHNSASSVCLASGVILLHSISA